MSQKSSSSWSVLNPAENGFGEIADVQNITTGPAWNPAEDDFMESLGKIDLDKFVFANMSAPDFSEKKNNEQDVEHKIEASPRSICTSPQRVAERCTSADVCVDRRSPTLRSSSPASSKRLSFQQRAAKRKLSGSVHVIKKTVSISQEVLSEQSCASNTSLEMMTVSQSSETRTVVAVNEKVKILSNVCIKPAPLSSCKMLRALLTTPRNETLRTSYPALPPPTSRCTSKVHLNVGKPPTMSPFVQHVTSRVPPNSVKVDVCAPSTSKVFQPSSTNINAHVGAPSRLHVVRDLQNVNVDGRALPTSTVVGPCTWRGESKAVNVDVTSHFVQRSTSPVASANMNANTSLTLKADPLPLPNNTFLNIMDTHSDASVAGVIADAVTTIRTILQQKLVSLQNCLTEYQTFKKLCRSVENPASTNALTAKIAEVEAILSNLS